LQKVEKLGREMSVSSSRHCSLIHLVVDAQSFLNSTLIPHIPTYVSGTFLFFDFDRFPDDCFLANYHTCPAVRCHLVTTSASTFATLPENSINTPIKWSKYPKPCQRLEFQMVMGTGAHVIVYLAKKYVN
jgi:hypothetical protein